MRKIFQTKAKPIFQEEKEFLENRLNIEIPNDCWIVGGGTKYVYLDIYSKSPCIKFKVHDDGKFELIRDDREKLKDYEPLTISQTIEQEKSRLLENWEHDVERTANFVSEYRNIPYCISISGGKDSEVLYNLWKEVLTRLDFVPDYEFIFFNTSNEVADVYRYIKARKDIRIINPEVGWYQFLKENNYMLPSTYRRYCCSIYKEGQAKKVFNTSLPRVQVTGMRNKESYKRSKYDFFMDYDFDKKLYGSFNLPKLWSKLCPVIDWSTTDVWLLIILKGFFINQKYKYGFTRVGCCICPFSNSYDDELLRVYYPKIWDRFTLIAAKNYERYGAAQVMGYSVDEFIHGAWKSARSKDMEFLDKKPTKENIHEYAEYKGLSDEMAAKFWNRECRECGKKAPPVAMSMFYRLYGRKEGEPDNRKPICVGCFCKQNNITRKQFYEMALRFKEEGCTLF